MNFDFFPWCPQPPIVPSSASMQSTFLGAKLLLSLRGCTTPFTYILADLSGQLFDSLKSISAWAIYYLLRASHVGSSLRSLLLCKKHLTLGRDFFYTSCLFCVFIHGCQRTKDSSLVMAWRLTTVPSSKHRNQCLFGRGQMVFHGAFHSLGAL